jgi:hypothetical protein
MKFLTPTVYAAPTEGGTASSFTIPASTTTAPLPPAALRLLTITLNNSTAAVTPPTTSGSWNVISNSIVNGRRVWMGWRVVTASSGIEGAHLFQFGAAAQFTAVLETVLRADNSAPIVATAGLTGSGTGSAASYVLPSVTPTVANSYLYGVVTHTATTGMNAATLDTPAGMTATGTRRSSNGTGIQTAAFFQKLTTGTAATGTRSAAKSPTTTTWSAITVALRPARPAALVNLDAAAGHTHYAFDIARNGTRQLYYPTQLTTLDLPPEFTTVDGWLQASAAADGETTGGSTNARVEARETKEANTTTGSAAHIDFNPLDGNTHWQRVRTRIMSHPTVDGAGVSVAQLHSGGDDMVMLRTRRYSDGTNRLVLKVHDPDYVNPTTGVKGESRDVMTLENNYVFGTVFDLMYLIHGGWVYVFYNDFTKYVYKFNAAAILDPTRTTYMFKWGNYNQFNMGTAGIVATDRGTSHFRNVNHWHTGWATPENYFNVPVTSVTASATVLPNMPVPAGTIVGTYTDGPTEFKWTILDGPSGAGTILGTTAAFPSWTPSTPGTYRIMFGAKNDEGWSNPAISTVTVSAPAPAVVRASAPGSNNTATWTQPLPIPITLTRVAGDALIVAISNDEVRDADGVTNIENLVTPDAASQANGWQVLATKEQGTSTNNRLTVLYKASATNTTADNLSVNMVAAQECTWIVTSVSNPGPMPPRFGVDDGGATATIIGIPWSGLPRARWLSLVFLGMDNPSSPSGAATISQNPTMPAGSLWTRDAVNGTSRATVNSSADTFMWSATMPENTTNVDPPVITPSVQEQWVRVGLLFQGTYPTSITTSVAARAIASGEVDGVNRNIRKVRPLAARPTSTPQTYSTRGRMVNTVRAKARPAANGQVTKAALAVRALKRIAARAQFDGVLRTGTRDIDVTTRLYATKPPAEAVVTKSKLTRAARTTQAKAAASGERQRAKLTKVVFHYDHYLTASAVSSSRIATMKYMDAVTPIVGSGSIRVARINDPFTWKGTAEVLSTAQMLHIKSVRARSVASGTTDVDQKRVRVYNYQLYVAEGRVSRAANVRIQPITTTEQMIASGSLLPRKLLVVPDVGIQRIAAESWTDDSAFLGRRVPYRQRRATSEGVAQLNKHLFIASVRSRAVSSGVLNPRKLRRVTLAADQAVTASGEARYRRVLLSRVLKFPRTQLPSSGIILPGTEASRVTPYTDQAITSVVYSNTPFLAVITALWDVIYADSRINYGSHRTIYTTAVGAGKTNFQVASMRSIRARVSAESDAIVILENIGIKQFLYVTVSIPHANLLTLKQLSETLPMEAEISKGVKRTSYLSSIVAILDHNGEVIRGEIPTPHPRTLSAPVEEETHVIKFSRPFGVLRR